MLIIMIVVVVTWMIIMLMMKIMMIMMINIIKNNDNNSNHDYDNDNEIDDDDDVYKSDNDDLNNMFLMKLYISKMSGMCFCCPYFLLIFFLKLLLRILVEYGVKNKLSSISVRRKTISSSAFQTLLIKKINRFALHTVERSA